MTKALEHLKEPIRSKYLHQVFEYPKYDFRTSEFIEEIPYTIHKSFKKLELFLLQYLKKAEVLELIDTLNPKFKEILFIYLEYYEELKANPFINYQDISKYKSYTRYTNSQEYALNFLRAKIKKLHVDDNPNKEIKTYLDYLMYNYLNTHRTKTRKLH